MTYQIVPQVTGTVGTSARTCAYDRNLGTYRNKRYLYIGTYVYLVEFERTSEGRSPDSRYQYILMDWTIILINILIGSRTFYWVQTVPVCEQVQKPSLSRGKRLYDTGPTIDDACSCTIHPRRAVLNLL